MKPRALRPLVIALVLLLVLPTVSAGAKTKSKWILLRPAGNPSYLELQGKDKTYRYYPVTAERSVGVEVVGPTRLRVATRLGFSPGMAGKKDYRVQVLEAGEVIKVYSTSTEKSDLTFLDSMSLPGKKRYFHVKVPKGKHRYEFRLSIGEAQSAYLRFYQEAKKDKPKYVSYQPIGYGKALNTVLSQKTARYYVATEKEPVVMQVIGPTKLKIIARGNVGKPTEKEVEFKLAALENGKEIRRVSAKRGKTKSFYPDERKLFPTSGKSLYLEIPAGTHTYEFYMLKCEAKSVSLRFFIPEEDLENR